MEGLDLNNILDEQDFGLFDDVMSPDSTKEEPDKEEKEETTEVDPDSLFDGEPESVGSEEDNKEKEDTQPADGQGTSPNIYSSIAKAFAEEGIFPDLDEDKVAKVKTPEDFRSLIDEYLSNALSEQDKRIKEALELDADTQAIRQFEGNISFLNGITDDKLKAENEQSEELRKRLIYQDYINRGFSQERAAKEVNKSIENGNDIDDALEALNGLKTFYTNGYKSYIQNLKDLDAKRKEENIARDKRIKDAIFDTKTKVFGDIDLDKPTRQKMFDSVSKAVYKDEETGELLNAIQKYARDNEEDFWVKMSFFYTMTDGFKSLDKMIGSKVKKGIKKGFRELENKLNSTSRDASGNLVFTSGVNDNESYFGKGIKLDF